jgi:hypothetical protein
MDYIRESVTPHRGMLLMILSSDNRGDWRQVLQVLYFPIVQRLAAQRHWNT